MLHPYEKACRSHEEWSLYKDEFEAKLKSGDKQALIAQKRYNEKLKKRKEQQMAEKKDIEFVDGLFIKERTINGKNGEFKIIGLGVNYEKFTEFCAKHVKDDGYINIDLKRTKEDKLYAELNTYVKKKNDTPEETQNEEQIIQFADEEDVPF